MVLWFPVFFAFQVFHRAVFTVRPAHEHALAHEELEARLRTRAGVEALDAARARAYADVLKAFALHAAEVQVEGDFAASQARLRAAIESFCAHDQTAAATYHAEVLVEVCDAPTRADVEAFRDLYVSALMRARCSLADARRVEAEVAALAAEELAIRRRVMSARNAARYLVWATAVKDKIAAALALLVWSAWMFAVPNVWVRWRDFGRKPECDNYIKLYFVFRGYNPWEDRFGTFLIVFSCIMIPIAVVTTLAALFLLTVGLFGSRSRKYRNRRRDVESTHEHDQVRVPERQSRYARCRHADEILTCVYSRETRGRKRRYRRTKVRPLHFHLLSIPWALILVVLLVYTIATVECMIRDDHVDFVRPDLHETAEILVFLLGLLMLVLVLWSVLERAVRFLLRRRKEKRSGHYHESEHHHEKAPMRGSKEELWKKGGPEHQHPPPPRG
jgi:hypothetical protein